MSSAHDPETPKLLVVLGVTGNQGSSVAHTFLSVPGWRIRGVTRSVDSPAAQLWSSQGVEIVYGNLDDLDSLVTAFTGAKAIFAVTDFWTHLRDGSNVQTAQATGVSINEFAYQREVQQGKNIAVAANNPTVAKTLERLVFSSLSDTKKWSNGKYTHNYHFDSKAHIVSYIVNNLPDLARKMSTVHIGHYVTNWRSGVMRPRKLPDGSFVVPHLGSISETPQQPFVVAHLDTGVFVRALLLNAPPSTHILGYSQMGTYVEFWTLWSDITGSKIEFREMEVDEYYSGVPEAIRAEVYDSAAYNKEFGWTGGDPSMVDVWTIDPQAKTTSLKEYMEKEDWSPLLK